jgi:hypothetical protein
MATNGWITSFNTDCDIGLRLILSPHEHPAMRHVDNHLRLSLQSRMLFLALRFLRGCIAAGREFDKRLNLLDRIIFRGKALIRISLTAVFRGKDTAFRVLDALRLRVMIQGIRLLSDSKERFSRYFGSFY